MALGAPDRGGAGPHSIGRDVSIRSIREAITSRADRLWGAGAIEDAEALFLQALRVAPDFHPALMQTGDDS